MLQVEANRFLDQIENEFKVTRDKKLAIKNKYHSILNKHGYVYSFSYHPDKNNIAHLYSHLDMPNHIVQISNKAWSSINMKGKRGSIGNKKQSLDTFLNSYVKRHAPRMSAKLISRFLPFIADDIPVTVVIVDKIKKLGYRARIIEMQELYSPKEIKDKSIDKMEIVVATLGFVEAEITAFTKDTKLRATIGVYNYTPKLPKKDETEKSVMDAVTERVPMLQVVSNNAQLNDVLDILRSLQPIADNRESVLNKLQNTLGVYQKKGWIDRSRTFGKRSAPSGTNTEAPLHQALLKLGFTFHHKDQHPDSGWPRYVYSHTGIPVAQMEKFAKENHFKIVRTGDKFRSYAAQNATLSFPVSSAGMVDRASYSVKPSRKIKTKADAGLPPGASPWDVNHHGVVTPAYNLITKSYVKACCMGPGKCPVCQREWEEKFGAPYPNKIISATSNKTHGETLYRNANHYTQKHATLQNEIGEWAKHATIKSTGLPPGHKNWEENLAAQERQHPKYNELMELRKQAAQHRVAYRHWAAANGAKLKQFKTIAQSDSRQIAETILEQLGGNKFRAMVAKNFVSLKSGLQFDISSKMAKNKANRVTVIYEPGSDEYNMTFYRLRNLDLKSVSSHPNLQAAQLLPVFRKETGLDTNL